MLAQFWAQCMSKNAVNLTHATVKTSSLCMLALEYPQDWGRGPVRRQYRSRARRRSDGNAPFAHVSGSVPCASPQALKKSSSNSAEIYNHGLQDVIFKVKKLCALVLCCGQHSTFAGKLSLMSSLPDGQALLCNMWKTLSSRREEEEETSFQEKHQYGWCWKGDGAHSNVVVHKDEFF